MSHYFEGEIALVTGGGSGIGRACCEVLAREGARVVVTDRDLPSAQHTLTLLQGPQQHLPLHLDVTDKASIEKALSSAKDHYGQPPSLLVNSAGVADGKPVQVMSEETWSKVIDINLKGTFLVSQAFTNVLLDHEMPAKGAIVNIASMLGKTGFPNYSPYGASKGGVMAFTKSHAAELGSKGVRVNCVMPSWTDTPMIRIGGEASINALMMLVPLGRLAQPKEIAEVIVFLLSDRSSYMVGACVEVSGGYAM